ncbi:hemerythrin family protein [Heliobacterium chlorum]|uniref:Hemerythrin family protein n=1 Tax=Heliobacterium chlorum TaxID=2698 RepID=A0ABR7T215_HELCL|nr:bacteriohemerythrin [Heliobacterium chlorum]MBC9784058.1 hemerythrin family protein [Heliobacterium chlorum]
MPFIDWDERYEVGIPQIDDEHKTLLAMVNQLYDAVKAGKSDELIEELIDKSIIYAGVHFSHEEKFLKDADYKFFHEHKQYHDEFTQRVHLFKIGPDNSKNKAMDLLNLLKYWFINHILIEDKGFSKMISK